MPLSQSAQEDLTSASSTSTSSPSVSFASEREAEIARRIVDAWKQAASGTSSKVLQGKNHSQPASQASLLAPLEVVAETLEEDNPQGKSWREGNWKSTTATAVPVTAALKPAIVVPPPRTVNAHPATVSAAVAGVGAVIAAGVPMARRWLRKFKYAEENLKLVNEHWSVELDGARAEADRLHKQLRVEKNKAREQNMMMEKLSQEIIQVSRESDAMRTQLARKKDREKKTADSLADARRRLAELSSSTQEERASFKKQSESWASTEAVMNERIETLRRRAEVLEQDVERTQSLATQYEQQYVDLAQTGTEDRTAIVDELRRSEELLLERLNAIQVEYKEKCRVVENLQKELDGAKSQTLERSDSMNARIADLEQQRKAAEETKTEQQREIQMLRNEMEMNRSLLKTSASDIENSQENIAELSELVDGAKNELAKARVELDEMMQRRDEAEQQVKASYAMIQHEKEKAMAAVQATVDELSAEHEGTVQQVATLKQELAMKGTQLFDTQREKQETLEVFRRYEKEKREELADAKSNLDEMMQSRVEMEQHVKQMKERGKIMQQEKDRAVAALQARVNQLSVQYDTMSRKAEKLKSEKKSALEVFRRYEQAKHAELASARSELKDMMLKRDLAEEEVKARSALMHREKEQAVAALQSRIDSLSKEHTGMRNEITTLKGELMAKGTQIEAMKEEKRSALEFSKRVVEAKHVELVAKNDSVSKEAATLKGELADKNVQLAKLQNEKRVAIEHSKRVAQEKHVELATAKQELEQMVQKRREAEEDMEARSAMTQKEKERAVAALQARVDELNKKHDGKLEQVESLKRDLAGKGAEIADVREEKRAALEFSNRVARESREEIGRLHDEMEVAQQQLDELSKKHDGKLEQVESLKRDLAGKGAEIADVREEKRAALEFSNRVARESREEIGRLHDEMEVAQRQLQESVLDARDTHEQMEDLSSLARLAQEELAAAHATMESTIDMHSETEEQMQAKVADMREEKRAALEFSNRVARESREEIGGLHDEMEVAQQQLDELSKKHDGKLEQVESLKRDLAGKGAEIADVREEKRAALEFSNRVARESREEIGRLHDEMEVAQRQLQESVLDARDTREKMEDLSSLARLAQEELAATHATMESTIDMRSETEEQMQAKVADMREEKRAALEFSNRVARESREEIGRLHDEMEVAQRQLQESVLDAMDTHEKMEDLSSLARLAQEELAATHATMESTIDMRSETEEQMQAKVADMREEKRAALEFSNRVAREETGRLHDEMEVAQRQLQESVLDARDTHEQMEDLSSLARLAQEELVAARTNLESTIEMRREAEERMKAEYAVIQREKEEEVATMQARIDELGREHDAMNYEAEKLKYEVVDQGAHFAEARQEKRLALEYAGRIVLEKQAEIADARANLQQIVKERDEVEGQMRREKDELVAAMQARVETLSAEHDGMIQEVSSLKRELEAKGAQITTAQEEKRLALEDIRRVREETRLELASAQSELEMQRKKEDAEARAIAFAQEKARAELKVIRQREAEARAKAFSQAKEAVSAVAKARKESMDQARVQAERQSDVARVQAQRQADADARAKAFAQEKAIGYRNSLRRKEAEERAKAFAQEKAAHLNGGAAMSGSEKLRALEKDAEEKARQELRLIRQREMEKRARAWMEAKATMNNSKTDDADSETEVGGEHSSTFARH
ncbi:hypothetical protein RI054_22g95210 [Pseudoscourfieldia marina]